MHQIKTRGLRAGVALLTLFCLLTTLTLSTAAQSAWPRGGVEDIRITQYEGIPVYVESSGAYIGDCYLINETTYAPLRALCDGVYTGLKISFDPVSRVASVTGGGLTLTAQDGAHYIVANGRYLYTDTPVKILSDGRTYVPIRTLCRALGVEVAWNATARSVRITGAYAPILSGDRFYDADTVYWLSRIISAESRGEPLLGQIAVGNVVLNRVAHPDYPNTVWGVIFDRRWGVQFSPVLDGSVYNKPEAVSVIAAKLCLEGVTVSPKALFFFRPDKSSSFWIPNNRPYAFRIGNHQFYY